MYEQKKKKTKYITRNNINLLYCDTLLWNPQHYIRYKISENAVLQGFCRAKLKMIFLIITFYDQLLFLF